MNKLLLCFSLSFLLSNIALAADHENVFYQFNGQSIKLDPYRAPKPATYEKGVEEATNLSTLPVSVDLNSLQTQVKYQSARGSCTFFSTTALIESLVKQRQAAEVNFSEEYMIWLTKGVDKQYPKDDASWHDVNVAALKKGGLMLERDLPFQPSWFTKGLPCAGIRMYAPETPEFCFSHNVPGTETLKKIISSEAFVPELYETKSNKIVEIMAKENHPVVVGVAIHPKGWNGKTGECVMTEEMKKECAQRKCGGHSILLTGYDLEKRLFIFKNSWGSAWGKNGYGTIGFDYVDEQTLGDMLTGHLTGDLPLPADYNVFPTYKIDLSQVQNSLVEGKIQSTFNASIQNTNGSLVYLASTLGIPLNDEPISNNNAFFFSVKPEFEKENGSTLARGMFFKNYTDELSDELSPELGIKVEQLDRSPLDVRQDVYLRLLAFVHGDISGWKMVTSEFYKLDFSF